MDKEVFDRLVQEFNDLNEQTLKCQEFIKNKEEFNKLSEINKDLLISQLKAMETYLSILSVRIGINNHFNEEDNIHGLH